MDVVSPYSAEPENSRTGDGGQKILLPPVSACESGLVAKDSRQMTEWQEYLGPMHS